MYRGRDTRLGRAVALKVLPAELAEDESYRRRLAREAKTISQLEHERICRLYDIGTEGETQYLVMEFLEGETLEDRMRNGPLSSDEVLSLGSQIADAIAAAHHKGVVHRDLKPGNVMLTEAGVKVLDFGLAREQALAADEIDTRAATAAAITGEGQLVGTMPYMAPEQLRGEPSDERTDIWSLGCVLYEMATGERAFRGKSQADLVAAILTSDPEPPSPKRALTPERLDHLVGRCLAKRREERWQSARDVALELRDSSAIASASGEAEVAAYRPTRLAVLPFDCYAKDDDLRQLAFGVAEAVIAGAAATAGPRHEVLPRSASFRHAGESAYEAAAELGADFAVEGSVSRIGDQIRIGAQLIDCGTHAILWSNSYSSNAPEILAFQDEVADSIVHGVLRRLWDRVQKRTRGDAFWHLNQRTAEDNEKAIALWQAELERDPSSMLARIMIATAYQQRLREGWAESRTQALDELERLARESVELAPAEWTAHNLMRVVHHYRGEKERALAAARRAFEAGDGKPAPGSALGLMLAAAGDAEGAIARLDEAIRDSAEDPELWRIYGWLGSAYLSLGELARAREEALRGLNAGANNDMNNRADLYLLLACASAHLGDLEEARDALGRARRLRPALSLELVSFGLGASDDDYRDLYLDGLRRAGLE